MSPDEQALFAGVVAAAADDLPRLVYADWLEERGRGALAGFIRAQCELSRLHPGDAGYFDALHRQEEATARVRGAGDLPIPRLADDVSYAGSIGDLGHDNYGSYRRGFPDRATIDLTRLSYRTAPAQIPGVLERLARDTTIRDLTLVNVTPETFAPIARTEALAQFTGLDLRPIPHWGAAVMDELVRSPHAKQLVRLRTPGLNRPKDLLPLGQLRELHLWDDTRGLEAQSRAGWLPRLETLALGVINSRAYSALAHAEALRRLTLHSPSLTSYTFPFRPAESGFRLPNLRQVTLEGRGWPCSTVPVLLAGDWPRLVSLHLKSANVIAETLTAISRCGWFAGVEDFHVLGGTPTPGALGTLVASPAAKTLRLLRWHGGQFGGADLVALARPGAFPALGALELPGKLSVEADDLTPAEMLQRWSGGKLLSLDLSGWKLGNAALLRLAENPAFANLTRLKLNRCQVSGSAAAALVRSPHLQNLVELDLGNNPTGRAALLLAERGLLPHLGLGVFTGSKVTPDERRHLQVARPMVWV